jgi:hypothetical protein
MQSRAGPFDLYQSRPAAAQNARMKAFYLALVVLALVTACDREGPAERAGEKIDRAAENARDAIRDATK